MSRFKRRAVCLTPSPDGRSSAMPADVRSRWRVALCGGAAIFVTIGAVCLLVDGPSVALPAFSSYEKARDSAQCQACLGRIQNLHDTERDALSAEVGTCKRIEKNCEDRCPVDSKECEQKCARASRLTRRVRAPSSTCGASRSAHFAPFARTLRAGVGRLIRSAPPRSTAPVASLISTSARTTLPTITASTSG